VTQEVHTPGLGLFNWQIEEVAGCTALQYFEPPVALVSGASLMDL